MKLPKVHTHPWGLPNRPYSRVATFGYLAVDVSATRISGLSGGTRRYRTLGLVWFDEVLHDGIYHQDWQIENDPQADAAFRLGLAGLNLAHP